MQKGGDDLKGKHSILHDGDSIQSRKGCLLEVLINKPMEMIEEMSKSEFVDSLALDDHGVLELDVMVEQYGGWIGSPSQMTYHFVNRIF